MKITKELVDSLFPRHGRTSCSDDNLTNGFGGWDGKYCPDTGKKEIRYPRCGRCYLLRHLGEDSRDMEFDWRVDVTLRFKEE